MQATAHSYGLRSDQTRLPKDASTREALARQVGTDGYQLLEWVQTADTSSDLRDLRPVGTPADMAATI
jgi:hypothetical protein